MQGSARKDVVFGAARVYAFTVPGPKWKSWFRTLDLRDRVDGYRVGRIRGTLAALSRLAKIRYAPGTPAGSWRNHE